MPLSKDLDVFALTMVAVFISGMFMSLFTLYEAFHYQVLDSMVVVLFFVGFAMSVVSFQVIQRIWRNFGQK